MKRASCRFGYEGCNQKHPEPPSITARKMSDEAARQVVLPRFASVDRWKSIPNKLIDPFSRYLKAKGRKFTKEGEVKRWSCGCVTSTRFGSWSYSEAHGGAKREEWEGLDVACAKHSGALGGRCWKCGETGELLYLDKKSGRCSGGCRREKAA